jgi:hypothetical protein
MTGSQPMPVKPVMTTAVMLDLIGHLWKTA